jgi:Ni/Co efflux regulator RcnB/surface antigen
MSLRNKEKPMKRFVTAVLALSLLSSTAAIAAPGDQNRDDRGYNRPGQTTPGDQDHQPNQGNPPGTFNNPFLNRSDVRTHTPRWSRGDQLPGQYRQNQYIANDWQQRGFTRPPRGYRWFRNDSGDFFLAAIATGMIVNAIYMDDRDRMWRQRYSRSYTYNDDVYYRECRNSPDPAGIIIGGLIGGLLGNAAGHGGNRTGTTIAGVIFGGAVGAALTSNLDCEDRSYAYKTYYDGFNSDRPGRRYNWNNPHNGHRGEFRLGSYYNDRSGFRCANFTQTVYLERGPQTATGRACRQPDGSWAIVN